MDMQRALTATKVISPGMGNFRLRVAEILEGRRLRDPVARAIDLGLIGLIVLNVIAIALESVPSLMQAYQRQFFILEVFSVFVFSIEYIARVWSCVELRGHNRSHSILTRLKFMTTPMVLVDLLAILPFYITFLIGVDLRFLRVMRLLRIFKLTRYSEAMTTMFEVLQEEKSVLVAAAFIMFILVVLASSGIYLIEQDVQPDVFGSIPAAMWWSIVTLTTVGYGDVTPITAGGKAFGALVAIVGVGMVAMPAGILASGFANAFRRRRVSFEQELQIALEDGELSEAECESLKRIQAELGVSEEDAEHLLRFALRQLNGASLQCPKCGHRI
ncbi:MAG: ion transporter [Pseudomonadales bacterium]|nr:ion transporter [Pseudomonadales bacterium]